MVGSLALVVDFLRVKPTRFSFTGLQLLIRRPGRFGRKNLYQGNPRNDSHMSGPK
jgi:hypothetical protein